MLRKFAELIVDYCVSVGEEDEVLVSASYESLPLLRELWREIVSRGGYPRLVLNEESLTEIFYKYASDKLLDYTSKIDEYIAENMDVRIAIISSTHTKPLVDVDPERLKRRSVANRKLTEIFMRRDGEGSLRWVVTAYPTKALAQEAGMSILSFEEFVYRAMKLYYEDPIKKWLEQTERQEKIREFLSKVSELRYVSDDTDLTVRVDGRVWINDDGKKNMPGGEVFTAPHEDGVDGYILFDLPSVWRGIEVKNVKLRFRKGEVVEASAEIGGDFLRKTLETDDGAKRLGELAFGLNYDIKKPIKQILFDEKIGGTIHMALGAAYPATGGKNVSAIHWDMIKDMSNAKVYADGDLIYENGRFVI